MRKAFPHPSSFCLDAICFSFANCPKKSSAGSVRTAGVNPAAVLEWHMGFFSGRLTSLRFKVAGRGPRAFGPEHLETLAAHAIGKQRLAAADGTQVGWIAGDHILDTRFDLAKNIVNDTLQFALRIDTQAI